MKRQETCWTRVSSKAPHADVRAALPAEDYLAGAIRALRDRYQVGQAVLAAILNTLSTACQWEIGEKRPSGPSVKLLSVPDRKGRQALL